ncbi:hypothetical protein MWH03_00325 [Klebsiella pneumoniae]|nr:hypothetical protein [Klebsiella pneumoniae]
MPALSDKQVRQRIAELRGVALLTKSDRYHCEADTFEELLSRRQAMKPIHFVVMQGELCNCEEHCDCEPPLYLFKDGLRGYGQATWTYHEDQRNGLMYWCDFLGLAGYWARDVEEAVTQLRSRLAWLDNRVIVEWQ